MEKLERLDEFGGAIRTGWNGGDLCRCSASRRPERSAAQKEIESRGHGPGALRLAGQPAAEAGVVHASRLARRAANTSRKFPAPTKRLPVPLTRRS
jgi:hypothetical protein